MGNTPCNTCRRMAEVKNVQTTSTTISTPMPMSAKPFSANSVSGV